jgi:hypothetical protein
MLIALLSLKGVMYAADLSSRLFSALVDFWPVPPATAAPYSYGPKK